MIPIVTTELPKTVVRNARIVLIACVLLLTSAIALGSELRVDVRGVDDALRDNVLAHIGSVRTGWRDELSAPARAEIIANGIRRTREALRPFGYYQPTIEANVVTGGDGVHVLELRVSPGEPVVVSRADIRVTGEGEGHERLKRWLADWPLGPGRTLNQATWEASKSQAIEEAAGVGFLSAQFTVQEIRLDLIDNTAVLLLTLDTGPRWVMGNIDFGEHVLKPGIVESIPRFETGEYYRATLLDNLRFDLLATGYFTEVEVREARNATTDPPSIDLNIALETEFRNRYQGAIGLGSDTGIRLQTNFSRHPMSSRGDRIDIGLGWREVDEETALRATYRIPRPATRRHYWLVDGTARAENRDLEVKRSDEDTNFIQVANGNIEDLHVRFGELAIRNRQGGDEQIFTTLFGQVLTTRNEYAVGDAAGGIAITAGDIEEVVRGSDTAASIGLEVRWVDVHGKGFDIRGKRDTFWAFTSLYTENEDSGFTQLYLATRRIYRVGERFKFLVRGEVGYTDSRVDEVQLDLGGSLPGTGEPSDTVELSVTRMPTFYRFRTGGSGSVRGYGFEQLSNNNVGSNNLLTGSVEVEMRLAQRWSAAVFADIGNAFNDWSRPQLKTGIGVGVRWYSIAGPISIDVAQAVDFEGRPWRIHFTIGTALL
jgi:translocation and assembly module TamA